MALLAATFWKTPWVHVEHGSDFPQFGRSITSVLARVYDHTLGRLVLRRADTVVAISQASAAFIQRIARADSQVIYRGIQMKQISAVVAEDLSTLLGIPTDAQTVMYAGRLIKGKGVADLIVAFAGLPATAHLLLVGDGPERRTLEALARNNPRIHFLGEQTREKVWQILKSVAVFVNPSYTEGLPSSVIEAIVCGTHTLATDVGGTREIPGVRLISPRDSEALSHSLINAINSNPQSLASRKKNALEAARRFSWNTASQQYDKIFTALTK